MASILVACAAVLYVFGSRVITVGNSVTDDHEVIHVLDDTLSTIKDAETGQRGFLLAGEDPYLEPYRSGVARVQSDLDRLDKAVADGLLPADKVAELKDLIHGKLQELANVLTTDKTKGRPAALKVIREGQDKKWMDRIRDSINTLRHAKLAELSNNQKNAEWLTGVRTGLFITCTLLELGFLVWTIYRIKREMDRAAAASELVEEQRELYATTLSSIGDAVITTDEQGKITFMNLVAEQLTGWTAAEVTGVPLGDIFRIINESTRLPVENPVEKVLRLGMIVGLANHTLLIRKDGSEIPIDDSGAPIRHGDGKIRGVVLVFRDFSEHKKSEAAIRRSEEQLRLAIEGAQLGTFYCTMPLDKFVWNDTCKKHFWLPPEAEVDVKKFYSILHPEDREPTRLAIDEALKNHSNYDIEYRTVSPDGDIRWVRAIGRFYYDGKNEPVRFDGITIDVSAAKTQEQVVQDARRQAEAANRAKDQFLATLSHELRTPLTPVLATLNLWDNNPGPPPAFRDDVQMIRRNIELEARLIDDLLDLTRVVKGKLVVTLEKVDVHELIRHVITVCNEDVQSKKIELRTRLEARDFAVKADSGRLQQVLWNILRNAVKFSPRQSIVEVATANDSAGHLRITISDRGIGMSPATIDKLFKPFEQGDADITRRFGGLGLGLAISKALLDVQGGTIAAHSEGLGRGSVFTITLPALSASDVARVAKPKPSTSTSGSRRLRILLAEDHVDTARILKLVMTNWGHSVETAGTVAGAVSLAKENHFDLLISDIGLPDGTGLDLMKRVREFSHMPGIALTGYGMDDDIHASRQAGFNAHLTKPTDLNQLQVSISKLADGDLDTSLHV